MTKGIWMTAEPLHVVDELRAMIDDERISLDAVHRITGIRLRSGDG